jgi:nicotinamidase-related amidase
MQSYKQSALVLIDMQRCMSQASSWPRNNPEAEDNMARLLTAWRANHQTVIHVRHLSPDPASGFRPGQSGADFQARFYPLLHEHVADKHVTDAFSGSGLEAYLRSKSIRELVVAGVSTNYSVEATVRSAGCLGFITTVVSDACFTFARLDLNKKMCSAEKIHLMSLSNLDGEYAQVLSTDEVLKSEKYLSASEKHIG